MTRSQLKHMSNPKQVIDSFRGEYAFLSNFFLCEIIWGGQSWPSAEHLYQALKTLKPEQREAIRVLQSPGAAKRKGRSVELRSDWDACKVETMREIIWQKFQPGTELATRLLATHPATLIEGNKWGDTFWGVCGGRGENWLGRILMERREHLRTL